MSWFFGDDFGSDRVLGSWDVDVGNVEDDLDGLAVDSVGVGPLAGSSVALLPEELEGFELDSEVVAVEEVSDKIFGTVLYEETSKFFPTRLRDTGSRESAGCGLCLNELARVRVTLEDCLRR